MVKQAQTAAADLTAGSSDSDVPEPDSDVPEPDSDVPEPAGEETPLDMQKVAAELLSRSQEEAEAAADGPAEDASEPFEFETLNPTADEEEVFPEVADSASLQKETEVQLTVEGDSMDVLTPNAESGKHGLYRTYYSTGG